MKRKKIVILPKLNDCNKDVTRKWFIYFSYRDPRTDKMKRFRVYEGFAELYTAKERYAHAERQITKLTNKLKTGWSPFKEDTEALYEDQLAYDQVARFYGTKRLENSTFRKCASEWLQKELHGVAPSTFSTYKSKLRVFNSWLDAKYSECNDVSGIDNDLIIEFFNWMIIDEKRSGVTIKKYREILWNVFEYIKEEKRKILINPVFNLPKCNRINDQSPSPIQAHDIGILKDEIKKDPQLWLACQFEYYCALRPGYELRMMLIKNIDFGRGLVFVERNRAKRRVKRTVVIPVQFLRILRNEYKLHTYPKEFYVFGKGGEPGTEHLGKNNFRNRFNRVRQRLNMPYDYKFYSWKHTGGVNASLAGIPDKHIQMQYGHTSLETTERYLRKMRGIDSKFLREQFPDL